jgi:hypothetical protein
VTETTPGRTADTMSEAIALSSPNGHMSKRARTAATKRLALALFGTGGLPMPSVVQPSQQQWLLSQAAYLRELAARGIRPRDCRRQAEYLEGQARALEATT